MSYIQTLGNVFGEFIPPAQSLQTSFMKKHLTLFLILLICTGLTHGQKQAELWYFGQNVGLNFANDTVVVINSSPMVANEGSASIANASGVLQFYTDGATVYTSNNLVMINGTGLNGNTSSTQSSLIIPNPGNSDLYFLFTTDADGGPGGLSYSVIDVATGSVTLKNQMLNDSMDEQLAGTFNVDGGYWLVAHDYPGDAFYAYKITSTGINTTPVISHTGTIHTVSPTNANGQMKFSKDGTRLALGLGAQGILEVLDFNVITGVVSNPVTIPGVEKCYGVEFSENGSRLYATHYNSFFDSYDVDQYDLSSGVGATIIASKFNLTNSFDAQLRQMQLAPNGKIYIAKAFASSLASIDNADSLTTGATYNSLAIDLDPDFFGNVSRLGLPNFMKSYNLSRTPLTFVKFDTVTICEGNCINFTNLAIGNNIDSWRWTFTGANQDTSTAENPAPICYPTPGIYGFTVIVGSSGGFDTLTVPNSIIVTEAPVVTIVISGDTLIANAADVASFQWYANGQPVDTAVSSKYIVTATGNYYVAIRTNAGCDILSDTTNFIVTGIPTVQAEIIQVYPNPSTGSWQLSLSDALVGNDMELYNATGQLVFQAKIRNPKLEIVTEIPTGIYTLRISTDGEAITRKLIRM